MLCLALALPLTGAWVPFPNPPQPLPRFAPSYSMFDSSIIMPCNYTGPFDLDFSTKWGIADIDWSNSKAQWVQDRPMTSEEELVAAAAAIRQRSNNATKVWIYRNLVYAPAWFTDVREKIVSNPEWFIRFKPDGPYNNSKCTFDKCSDLFHSQFQTPEYQSGSVKFGSCDHVHCDCGENVPCGWYLWNHSHPDCRQWLVQEHMMGNMSMGNPNVQGNFIDDEWFEYVTRLVAPSLTLAAASPREATNVPTAQVWSRARRPRFGVGRARYRHEQAEHPHDASRLAQDNGRGQRRSHRRQRVYLAPFLQQRYLCHGSV